MQKIKHYTRTQWAKIKCNCGDPMCDSYFINVARSDGRFGRHDAEIIILAPTLYEQYFKMLETLEEINGMCADAANKPDGKLDLDQVAKLSMKIIKDCKL